MGAVVVLIRVPPAGAAVVLAGHVAAGGQVGMAAGIARVDDADLARAGVRAGQLVGLHGLDAPGHQLAGRVGRAGAGRGAGVGVAARVLLDVLDVGVARQAVQRRGRHFHGHGVHAEDVQLVLAARGRDGGARLGGLARLEGHDDAGGVGGRPGGAATEQAQGQAEGGEAETGGRGHVGFQIVSEAFGRHAEGPLRLVLPRDATSSSMSRNDMLPSRPAAVTPRNLLRESTLRAPRPPAVGRSRRGARLTQRRCCRPPHASSTATPARRRRSGRR